VRQLAGTETGVPTGYLAEAGDLGWFAMLLPEDQGGGSVSGEPIRDLALVAEERGRGLQPGPFVPLNVVAAAIARSGSPAQRSAVLTAIAGGRSVATWAAATIAGEWRPGEGVHARLDGEEWVLDGGAGLVQDAAVADWLLVAAGAPEGLTQFLVPGDTPGITVARHHGHDITQRFDEVRFEGVRIPGDAVLGTAGQAEGCIEAQLRLALVLEACESVGAADVLFEMAREYAVDRTAFGRPIGSFQAVKHQLADMSLSLEAAKALVAAAVRAVQDEAPDAGEVASMAKAWTGDVGIDIAQGCFQIFGGIGYTWEHDSHLFLRRLTMNSLLFGQPDFHRERICALHQI